MDNTLITPLGDIKPRPFQGERRIINKVSACVFLYLFFVLYPAYVALRWLWNEDYPVIDLESFLTALVTSVLLALFVRRSVTNRVIGQVEAGQ